MKRLQLCQLMLALAMGLVPLSMAADDRGDSFLMEGDRWLFVGDSITHTDTYRQLILRLLQHHHPSANIMIGNSAVNGVASDYDAKQTFTPTVVTILLGMNDVIHQDWAFSPDLQPKCDAYRVSLTKQIRTYKELGAEVILLTPTYTDERFPTYFNVAATRRFLEAFGRIVRELAEAEGCHWIPVAEELEAYQDTLGIDQHVRPDGVHPYGLGQYQIARSLYSRLNLAGRLSGKRLLAAPPTPLALNVTLASRFMHEPKDGVTLHIAAPQTTTVEATWSLGPERGSETLELGEQPVAWRVPVPEKALTMEPGQWQRLVVEFTAGSLAWTCFIDLARTRVMRPVDGVITGTITGSATRPEGETVGTWRIEEAAHELWFSGEVFDSDNVWVPGWPFMRDGVQLWLDLRPAERFGGINPDRDVSATMINVREKPHFSVTAVPWIRPRLVYSQVVGGSQTPSGYRWHYGICGNVTATRKVDIRTLDFYGFNLIICDNDAKPANGLSFFPVMKIDAADQMRRLNLLIIIDRKGTFPGDTTTNLHLFP